MLLVTTINLIHSGGGIGVMADFPYELVVMDERDFFGLVVRHSTVTRYVTQQVTNIVLYAQTLLYGGICS